MLNPRIQYLTLFATVFVASTSFAVQNVPDQRADKLTTAINAWQGEWTTSYGPMVLDFDNEGRFKGHYGSSKHALRGKLDDSDPSILTGSWKHTGSTSNGLIRFQLSDDRKSFRGSYTSGETKPNPTSVNWTGTRPKNPEPKFREWKKGEQPVWTGTWKTSYGDLIFIDKGDGRLEGAYGTSEHSVWATIDKKTPKLLYGRWKHTNSDWSGRFVFRMDSPDHFQGSWTSGENEPSTTAINWEGTRNLPKKKRKSGSVEQ